MTFIKILCNEYRNPQLPIANYEKVLTWGVRVCVCVWGGGGCGGGVLIWGRCMRAFGKAPFFRPGYSLCSRNRHQSTQSPVSNNWPFISHSSIHL